MNKKGFTYIETLISITVFAIIISIFVASYKNFTNYNERNEVKSVVQIVKKARLSAIMQSTSVKVNVHDDIICVSNLDETKIEYKLKYLKVLDAETFIFTAQGGTIVFNNVFDFSLKSNKNNKRYNIIIAAVGGQVRYEEE